MTHWIKLFTKDDCTLCSKTKAVLEKLQIEYDLAIEEIDITLDEELYQTYRYMIPVVVIDGKVTLELRISEARLRQALKDLSVDA